MPSAEHLSTYFEYLQIVLLTLLAFRLALTGLFRSYPIFFLYIVFQIPDSIVPIYVDTASLKYLSYWEYTQPLIYLIQILLVAELCRLILARHPGIYSLGKWAMATAVVIALFISLLSLIPRIKPHTPQLARYLQYFFAAQRGLDFGLGLFLLLMLAFLSRFPVRLSRNTLIYAGLYTFYFFAATLEVFTHTLFGFDNTADINLLVTIVACICVFAWLLLLSPAGETQQTALPGVSPERETRILEQLDALNTTLMRAGRKK